MNLKDREFKLSKLYSYNKDKDKVVMSVHIEKAIKDMNSYLDIALNEMILKNNKDCLNMLAIENNQERLKSILNRLVFGDFKDE